MKRKLLIGFILLIPLSFLIPHLSQFIYPPNSDYSDIAISHFPNAVYLLQSIQTWKQIPLWSDSILSGYPFAADPLSGLWYPPGWLALIFPLPFGFNLMVLAHLWFGGLGMFLFLKKKNVHDLAAMFGAISFELMPKLLSHFSAGHLTLLYAVPLTSWLFFFEEEYWAQNHKRNWLLPGLVLGMIFLADVRWGAYAGLLWLGYRLFHAISQIFHLKSDEKLKIFLKWTAITLFTGLFSLLIAAPLLIPLEEYTALSTRILMSAADRNALALPISGLFGLIFPNLQGYAEWILYPGGMTLLLAILGLTWKGNKKEIFFWLGVFLICLLLALGPVIPVLSWFFSLPGLNQLRVPARSLFLCGLALSILAAYGMETLLSIDLPNVKNQKRFSVSSGLFVVITFVDLAAAGLCWINGKVILDFIWGAVTISLAGLLYLSVKKQWIGRTYWPFLMIGLCVFDLGGVNVSHIVFKDSISVIAERQDVISTLSKDIVAFRTYSPSYSIPQQTAAAAQLEMTDGIDPIQLKSYVDFMEKASGIGQTGYSVTMPPLVGDNPHQSNQKAVPDAGLLGLLNVRYIVSDYPIQADGLRIFKQENGVWVYTNQMGLPRVWVQEANAVIGTKIINEPSLRWTPNLIQIDAHGPGLLVLSELNYPGWLVRVDGKKGDLIPVNGLLRGVKIPEGEHQVVFEFAPVSVGIGLVCALFGWILFFIVEAISRRK